MDYFFPFKKRILKNIKNLKNFKKRMGDGEIGEIAFALTILFQLPQEHLSFLQNSLSQKYLKQEHRWTWTNVAPMAFLNWRYKDLLMSHDQKVMTVLVPMQLKVPCGPLSRSYFCCPNLIAIAPVTRDKEICQRNIEYEVMASIPPDAESQWNPLNEVYLLS